MNISGPLSQLLKGLDMDKMPIKSFIGLPINDSNGKQIGIISSIDIDNDLWHGAITSDGFRMGPKPTSTMEILSESIPTTIAQSGIPLNAIREHFGLESINNYEKENKR